jgi:baculoviral IAP repeat-containing protein 5
MEKGNHNDSVMLNMSARLATFTMWPFTEDCSCTPQRMAGAGFYCCGGENEPDLVRCYFCRKELDGWEPEDDPWTEHLSHAKGKCAFVRLGKKPEDLTVSDVLGLLEGEKYKVVLSKSTDAWAEKFGVEEEEMRREIDGLAPNGC